MTGFYYLLTALKKLLSLDHVFRGQKETMNTLHLQALKEQKLYTFGSVDKKPSDESREISLHVTTCQETGDDVLTVFTSLRHMQAYIATKKEYVCMMGKDLLPLLSGTEITILVNPGSNKAMRFRSPDEV